MANPYHGNLPDRSASTAGRPNAPKAGPGSAPMPMRATAWPKVGPTRPTAWPSLSPSKRIVPSQGGTFE